MPINIETSSVTFCREHILRNHLSLYRILKHIRQRTHSIENTFCREHILQRTHSIENTFYREHILQRTHSTIPPQSVRHFQTRKRPSLPPPTPQNTHAQQSAVCMQYLHARSTFYREHILQRTHSVEDTFYREHILQRTHSVENTFCREHILSGTPPPTPKHTRTAVGTGLDTENLLFCYSSRSLLLLQQVSFATAVGLFCYCSRSLLLLQQVSFATVVGCLHTGQFRVLCRQAEAEFLRCSRHQFSLVQFSLVQLGQFSLAPACRQTEAELLRCNRATGFSLVYVRSVQFSLGEFSAC